MSGIRAGYSSFVTLYMYPTSSGYKHLGHELVDPLQDWPQRTRWSPMGEENRDDGIRYQFKFLVHEALVR